MCGRFAQRPILDFGLPVPGADGRVLRVVGERRGREERSTVHQHPIASDHGQRIIWPAGRACRPVEVGGERHGRQDTAGRRKGCDKGAVCGRELVRRRDSDGALRAIRCNF